MRKKKLAVYRSKAEIACQNRRRGKRNEKKLAELMDMDRVGIFGGEDGKDETFSCEWKSRKRFIGSGWMAQAVTNCPKNKVPLVVIHTTGQRRMTDLVMVRLGDWIDLYGELKLEDEAE